MMNVIDSTPSPGPDSLSHFLHAGHFAFMRAVIQGLDPRKSWERYLRVDGAQGDAAAVQRLIGRIRAEFAAAARRHGRPGTARLVVMELSSGGTSPTVQGLPALADFIQLQNLENFSEAEQIQLYQQHHIGGARSQLRRTRLLGRQLEALNWLQQTVAQLPQTGDAIANWIDPGLADHLARAGLHRLTDLITHMNRFGARWWRGIEAIGVTKATRIAQWLALHPSLGGVASALAPGGTPANHSYLEPPAPWLPRPAARHQFTPLDQLTLPIDITQEGPLRAAPAACRIVAADDLSAIRAWLGAKARLPLASNDLRDWAALGPLSHTQRAYWKEAERFILWLLLERRIALSSVAPEDCVLYLDFLAAPTPPWCAPRGRGKRHPQWRPFEGALSLSARRFAATVLRGMCRYLVKQRYLTLSPWESVPVPSASTQMHQRRGFGDGAWQAIDRTLTRLPATSANQRLELAIALISTTGLRVGQLVQCRVGDLYPAPKTGRWSLHWSEPGRPERKLPLPACEARRVHDHLRDRGLEADPQAPANRHAYLLGMAADAALRAPWAPCARQPYDPMAGIGAGTLRDQVKKFFQRCRADVAATDPLLAAEFAAASSEWLRPGRIVARRISSAGVAAAVNDADAISRSAKSSG